MRYCLVAGFTGLEDRRSSCWGASIDHCRVVIAASLLQRTERRLPTPRSWVTERFRQNEVITAEVSFVILSTHPVSGAVPFRCTPPPLFFSPYDSCAPVLWQLVQLSALALSMPVSLAQRVFLTSSSYHGTMSHYNSFLAYDTGIVEITVVAVMVGFVCLRSGAGWPRWRTVTPPCTTSP